MAVASEIYPNPKNKPVGPLSASIPILSVQIERISGSGAVGTYLIQASNSGQNFVDAGVVSGVGMFEASPSSSFFFRVSPVTPPDPGTVVLVSLCVVGVSEGGLN